MGQQWTHRRCHTTATGKRWEETQSDQRKKVFFLVGWKQIFVFSHQSEPFAVFSFNIFNLIFKSNIINLCSRPGSQPPRTLLWWPTSRRPPALWAKLLFNLSVIKTIIVIKLLSSSQTLLIWLRWFLWRHSNAEVSSDPVFLDIVNKLAQKSFLDISYSWMDHYSSVSHFKVDGKVWFFISAGFQILFQCFPHQSLLWRFVNFASFWSQCKEDWRVEGLPCYLQSKYQI